MVNLDLGWPLKPMTLVLIEDRRGRFDTERHVKTAAEIGVKLPAATRSWERDL